MQYTKAFKIILVSALTISTISALHLRNPVAASSTVTPQSPRLAGNRPKSKAPFFDENTISLIKTFIPVLVDKLTYTDQQFSSLTASCVSNYREKRAENLTPLREFWENCRNVFDGNSSWKNDFWNNIADSFGRITVNDDKGASVNCGNFLKNMKAADTAKISEILKRAEFFGAFNKAVPADKSHMITSMFGPRRRHDYDKDKDRFKRMNDVSRGKGL